MHKKMPPGAKSNIFLSQLKVSFQVVVRTHNNINSPFVRFMGYFSHNYREGNIAKKCNKSSRPGMSSYMK